MHVLIADLWAATQPSGICRTVANLVRGLNDIAPHVELTVVIGEWQQQYFVNSFDLAGERVQVVPVSIRNRSIDRNWWYLAGLPRLARQMAADVVHLAFPAPLIRGLFRCPIVTTLHDLYPYDSPKNFGYTRVVFNRVALRQALASSERIACVSKFTLTRLSNIFPNSAPKAVYIRNSVRTIDQYSEETLHIDGPFVLTVAQHRSNKNLSLLLRSFHLFRAFADSPPDLKLAIVGMRGPETSNLERLVESLGLRESVFFFTNLKDAQLAAFYRNCDLFVTLSTVEGFGLPLAEAIAYGARAIASDVPVHREIGEERCEYVDLRGNDVAMRIAEGMRLCRNRTRADTQSVSQHSKSDNARRYLELYEEACQRPVAQVQHSKNSQSAWEQR